MAKKKKFFNTKVKSKRKTVIKLIFIGIAVVLIIVAIIVYLVVNMEKKPQELEVKNELTVELNQTITDQMFFTSKSPNLDNVYIVYPDNFDNTKIGTYEVTVKTSNSNYKTVVNIVDTTSPSLVLKNVTLNPFRFYTVNDFVESCSDNSGEECNIAFYTESVDKDGKKIDYSNLITEGKHDIKIIAKDSSGNETLKDAKLTIGNSNNNEQPKEECNYGDDTYDESQYIMASKVAVNGCALNIALYNDNALASNINKLMSTETLRIKKDLDILNPDGTIALNRTINVILNNAGTGMVGYELRITVTLTKNKKSETIADYKVDADGKRIFITNPKGLAN